MHTSSTLSPCPGCGRDPQSTLACLQCGRLLQEPADATHFQRLGAPAEARVDREPLERRYLRLSRLLHPDFHGGADEALRDLAVRNSARLNEAWAVLTDEQERAEYLLGLHDPSALERGEQLAPAFLMGAMETSEAVEEAAARADRAALEGLARQVRAEIDTRLATLADPRAWDAPDTGRLATLLHELRVYRRILHDTEKAA